MDAKPEKLLKITEVADLLSCSKRHVYRLVQQGEFDVLNVGDENGLRITENSLNAFIQERKKLFEQVSGIIFLQNLSRDDS